MKNLSIKVATMSLAAAVCNTTALAETIPISGMVESRCIIQTDTPGIYGNPNAYTLTTDPTLGGVPAIIRFDVTLADAYYAAITAPTEFSSSPNLPDVVTWVGDTEVEAMTDASGMGNYEADKVEYNYTDRYDLTATGSTWFKTTSEATLGGTRPFPGGNYTALVTAECIAK
jgi:hypothetical protein